MSNYKLQIEELDFIQVAVFIRLILNLRVGTQAKILVV